MQNRRLIKRIKADPHSLPSRGSIRYSNGYFFIVNIDEDNGQEKCNQNRCGHIVIKYKTKPKKKSK